MRIFSNTTCLLLFHTFIVVTITNAQDFNTRAGFIVTHHNDTIHGLIKDFSDLSQKIYFKASNGTVFQNYLPEEIFSFYLTNGYVYKPKLVSVDRSPFEMRFLLCLAEGEMNLYNYNNAYYIEKSSAPLIEVVRKDTTINDRVIKSQRFRGVLHFLTADYPSLRPMINKMKYSDKHMIAVVMAYNNHKAPASSKVFDQPSHVTLIKGLKAGIHFHDMKYTSKTSLLYDDNFKPAVGITAGGWINLSYEKKITTQIEILISQRKSSLKKDEDDYIFSQTSFQLPISVYYFFPFKKVHPFASAGGTYSYALSQEAYRKDL